MEATTITDETMAIAEVLRPTLLRLARELRREARDLGFSQEQVSILAALKRAPGTSAGDLADAERVSRAAISKLLSRMERDGLIERTPSETDRRRVGLDLTAEGKKLLRRIRSRRTAWLAARLRALEAGERAAVAAALEPLARLLHESETPA